MRSSIRWTLLGWYGLILTLVLGLFGAMSYQNAARAVTSRHDALIESRARALAAALANDPDEGWELELSDDYMRAVAETTYFAIWDSGGKLLRSSAPPPAMPPPAVRGVRQRGDQREYIAGSAAGATVLVGLSLAEDRARLARMRSSIALGGSGVLALALLGGLWLARRTMAPIARISERAAHVSARDLSVRLDTAAVPRELEGLCRTLNDTFARLEEAFARQTSFTADASHELRTPLATVRAHSELALQQPRSTEEYQEALRACLRAAERMTGVVEGLLALARADSGADRLRRGELWLDEVVRGAVAPLRPAAESRGLSLGFSMAPALVWGDPERLADVVTNLVSNAIRYNRDGGRVDISVAATGDTVELTVADTGIGIPPEVRARVFDRFFRVDPARSRAAGGSGLGLAIAKWIVEAHGGVIVNSERPGGGSLFTVRLPAATGRDAT